MTEPQVKVGILTTDHLHFTLTGIYSTADKEVVTGKQEVSMSDSGLALSWEGKSYTTIEFTPSSLSGDSFELEGVTIGVNFHWERRENQRFRGSLLLKPTGGKITVINSVGIEEYLTSVISSEMSSTSSLPLLRAHAVISRSWVLAQMGHRTRQNTEREEKTMRHIASSGIPSIMKYWDHEDHTEFDVCADDHCQRYQGITRISTSVAASAVADTRGEVLTYQGELCDTRFSKCCGGVFEKFSSCWEEKDYPYLQPRRDGIDETDYPDLTVEENAERWIMDYPKAFCNTTDSRILSQVLNNYDRETPDFYRWSVEIDREKIKELVASRLEMDLGDIIDLIPTERGTSGRIIRLVISGTKGKVEIGKELMIRRTLSDSHLYSSAFTVERNGIDPETGVPERFILHGAGWGHGAGLCQIGAAIMGDRGYRYNEILAHYYPHSEIKQLY